MLALVIAQCMEIGWKKEKLIVSLNKMLQHGIEKEPIYLRKESLLDW